MKNFWKGLGIPDMDGDGDVDLLDAVVFDDVMSDEDDIDDLFLLDELDEDEDF